MPDKVNWSQGAAWISGEIVPIADAKIGVTDWGLTHSDITYDVAQVWDGAFFRLEDYLTRFMASMDKVRISVPQTRDEIGEILHAIVARSGLRAAYAAMVASRGVPMIPGTRDPTKCANHFYAWCVPFVYVIPPDVAKRGSHLWIAKTARRIPDDSVDPTAKNYHWGDFTKGLFEAKDNGFDSVLLLDHAGNVTEGPGFNVFAVIGGTVVTPKSGVLEGITRRTVLEVCSELGVPAEVRALPVQEFMEADEVFTVTTGGGPVSVTKVDDRVFSNGAPGEMVLQIAQRYWDWHQREDLIQPVDYAGFEGQ